MAKHLVLCETDQMARDAFRSAVDSARKQHKLARSDRLRQWLENRVGEEYLYYGPTQCGKGGERLRGVVLESVHVVGHPEATLYDMAMSRIEWRRSNDDAAAKEQSGG